jgi:hypothetical protein
MALAAAYHIIILKVQKIRFLSSSIFIKIFHDPDPLRAIWDTRENCFVVFHAVARPEIVHS